MTKLPLPLWSFKHCEPFRGTLLLRTSPVFSEHSVQLRQLQPAHPIKGLHKRIDPLIVSQDTIYDPAPRTDDLGRYFHDPIEKPTKLHSQKLISLRMVLHQQRKPWFQGPCQGCHHHIRPVRDQSIHRHPQRIDAILELLNEVFLVAPLIAQPHHFCRTQVGPVGDIEEVPNIIPQLYLAFLNRQTLFEHNDSIGAFALRRLITELRNMLAHQSDVSVSFFNHNLFLKILGPCAPLPAQRFLLPTPQHTPALTIKAISDLYEVSHRIYPKRKTHSLFAPAIKLRSQGKLRITPQTDLFKTLANQPSRPINPFNDTVMGNTVARTVDQIQKLHRVGKGDQKRVVAP